MWDGQIKLYNVHSQRIYAGLLDYVIKFAEDRNYSYEVNPELKLNDFQNDLESMKLKHHSSAIDDAINDLVEAIFESKEGY